MKNKGKEKVVKYGQVSQCVIRGGKNWLLNKGTQVWGYRATPNNALFIPL